MSEAVERRIVAMLEKPLVCPHGNPIPGLDDLGLPFSATDDQVGLITLSEAGSRGDDVVIARISEQIQPDAELMHELTRAGVRPGKRVHLSETESGLEIWAGDTRIELDRHVSDHIFVRPA